MICYFIFIFVLDHAVHIYRTEQLTTVWGIQIFISKKLTLSKILKARYQGVERKILIRYDRTVLDIINNCLFIFNFANVHLFIIR